jgi:hypothetical protein
LYSALTRVDAKGLADERPATAEQPEPSHDLKRRFNSAVKSYATSKSARAHLGQNHNQIHKSHGRHERYVSTSPVSGSFQSDFRARPRTMRQMPKEFGAAGNTPTADKASHLEV